MKSQDNYILWLPLWYPNRTEPFSGDFIQRHARAASVFRQIEVLTVIRDLSMRPGTREEVRSEVDGLAETIIYYNTSTRLYKPLNRLRSFLAYCRILNAWCRRTAREKGIPVAIHLHVYGKSCLMGWLLSQRWRIPLFFSEHQSGWLHQSPQFFLKPGSVSKFLFGHFISRLNGVSFVSQYLAAAVTQYFPQLSYSVIPNVVDERFFYPSLREEANEKIRFIHISTLTYEKNFEGIIQACQRLVNSSGHFEMHVIGPVTSEWRQMVKKAGLDSYILFHGEQPHEMILSFLQSADALVHYSRFETFGCVVIEALSCGIPVIVSDIPSMHELVKDGEDGVIVAGEYPDKLADVMLEFIRHPLRPNRAVLHRHTVDRFGMRRVGEMFDAFYREVK